MNKLNILLTNDDGISAEGINVLAENLRDAANVYILAPHINRSGVSSHLDMESKLEIFEVGKNVYAYEGYPVNCVITGLRSKLFGEVKFDCVFSGINHGPNMGTDCIYSGTVAAARQAVLYGVPGIAVSLKNPPSSENYDFAPFARFLVNNLSQLVSLFRPNVILNINAPHSKKFNGVKFSSLCVRNYADKVEVQNSNGKIVSHFRGDLKNTFGEENNEYETVKNGCISITRLFAEPVCLIKNESCNFNV